MATSTPKSKPLPLKERLKMCDEITELLLKRAGKTKEDVYRERTATWLYFNQDLFTPAERRKYKSVMAPW